MRVYIGDHGRLDKVPRAVMSTADHEAAFLFAYLDIVGDLFHGVLIDDRSHIGLRFSDVAYGQPLCLLDYLLQDLVVDWLDNDSTRPCRTLLSLQDKRANDNPTCSCITPRGFI